MLKLTLQKLPSKNKVEADMIDPKKESIQIVKTLMIALIYSCALLLLGMMSGISNYSYSKNSKLNTSAYNPFSANETLHKDQKDHNDNLTGDASGICMYNWLQQVSGTTSSLNSASAVSDQIGWAAGDGPTVRRTTDGGTGWTNATGTGITGDIYNIFAIDENTALCTTTPLPGSTPSFIYRTSNGGLNWTQVYATAVNGFINAIQMISSSEGYAVGDPLSAVWTVLKTTNGGVNWTQIPSAPAQAGSEAGWNNSLIIVGNDIWFGTDATKVYHSTDLGSTWTSGTTTGTVNSYAVHFNTSTAGLAGGSAMVASSNGGTSYSLATLPASGTINAIEGAGTDWWSTVTGANVYRSTNGGLNWNIVYTQVSVVFRDMDFAVVSGCPSGWVVGDGGAIAKMNGLMVGVASYSGEVPDSYALKQNFPNPFNPSTNINFSIPKSGLVTLKVYDMTGKEVATLVNEVRTAGNYLVGFNASGLPSGVYFYKVSSGNFADTKKMLLTK